MKILWNQAVGCGIVKFWHNLDRSDERGLKDYEVDYEQFENFPKELLMKKMGAICYWTSTNLIQRNFEEGEILKDGHVIECGKNIDKYDRSDSISFTVSCWTSPYFMDKKLI